MLTPHTVVLGFTAAFGSGSTTAGKHLRDSSGFRLVTLSAIIREEWHARNGDVEPTRRDLQRLGDELRESEERMCSSLAHSPQ